MQVDPFNDPDGRGMYPIIDNPTPEYDPADVTPVSEASLRKIGVIVRDGFMLNTITPTRKSDPAKVTFPGRKFDTGATRDQDTTKPDYEGFLSPLALTRFAAYMHMHRVQDDGTTRASDNWQKGIPLSSYMKSLWRHLITVWMHHREVSDEDCEDLEEALCGVIFNAQGYLHEVMKLRGA